MSHYVRHGVQTRLGTPLQSRLLIRRNYVIRRSNGVTDKTMKISPQKGSPEDNVLNDERVEEKSYKGYWTLIMKQASHKLNYDSK